MAVLEEAKDRILTRLKELEPDRREYDELLAAAKDLKLDYDPDASNGVLRRAARQPSRDGGTARAARAARGTRRQGKRQIAPRGQRKEQVLAVVGKHPDGITVAQVGQALGLRDATSLYRVQSQLVAEGLVRKDGAQMFPVASEPASS